MNTEIHATATAAALKAPNLALQAPRSPRCALGGYAILPRLLDKCRASIAGAIGDYHTNCAIDQEFLAFVGIDYAELREQAASGKTDGELLLWIEARAATPRAPWEIEQWSAYQARRAPAPLTEAHDYFMATLASHSKDRGDVRSWADLLDLDDYCSFGGAA